LGWHPAPPPPWGSHAARSGGLRFWPEAGGCDSCDSCDSGAAEITVRMSDCLPLIAQLVRTPRGCTRSLLDGEGEYGQPLLEQSSMQWPRSPAAPKGCACRCGRHCSTTNTLIHETNRDLCSLRLHQAGGSYWLRHTGCSCMHAAVADAPSHHPSTSSQPQTALSRPSPCAYR